MTIRGSSKNAAKKEVVENIFPILNGQKKLANEYPELSTRTLCKAVGELENKTNIKNLRLAMRVCPEDEE